MGRLEEIEKKINPDWEISNKPPQQYWSWLSPQDTDYLFSEVHRLRDTIKKHKAKTKYELRTKYDAELYKALEEE